MLDARESCFKIDFIQMAEGGHIATREGFKEIHRIIGEDTPNTATATSTPNSHGTHPEAGDSAAATASVGRRNGLG
jgi:hypothetical protein